MKNFPLLLLFVASSWCFNSGYKLTNVQKNTKGFTGQLDLIGGGPYGNDIPSLNLDVQEGDTGCRIRITDAANQRFEVPFVLENENVLMFDKPASSRDYVLSVTMNPFGFALYRPSTNEQLFNSTPSASTPYGGLVYEDQYLEINTALPSKVNFYGLGERIHALRLDSDHDKHYVMWNRDEGTPVDKNLYGTHPFYMDLRASGAHGVFWLNSNAQDAWFHDSAFTWKSIGGIVDLFFFAGPSPQEVVQQYTALIGRPVMPPYWAMGWHQCRWGYKTMDENKAMVNAYKQNNLPLDVAWSDIDYMDAYQDFTFDPNNYPVDQVKDYVTQLHNDGQHYITIVDPGIPPNYPPYQHAMAKDLFIKDVRTGKPLVGKVWPGLVAYPDFSNPNTSDWWQDELQTWMDTVGGPDAIWIDMNEVANFCNGACDANKKPKIAGFDPENPPFNPAADPLDTKTVRMDSLSFKGIEYNMHNLYGHTECMVTNQALTKIKGKRPFVLTRSSFAGTGKYAAHWLGDNDSDWDDLYYSIPGMLTMSLFGFGMVGSDICGFGGDTTEELCTRWMELGVWYPFSRNHNSVGQKSQEPYAFSQQMTDISRKMINAKYELLPYYYTCMATAHQTGSTVARPMFFEWPGDSELYYVDRQFLVGAALMISPQLTEGSDDVAVYFPANERWYEWFTGVPQTTSGWVHINTPIDAINVHVRGGYVFPTQGSALTTTEARKNPFSLMVALDASGNAAGELFLDDGDSIGTIENKQYTQMVYSVSSGTLNAKAVLNGWSGSASLVVDSVRVLGLASSPTTVQVGGANWTNWSFNNKVLSITQLGQAIVGMKTVSWS